MSLKTYFRHLCWDCYFKKVLEQFDVHRLARKGKWYRKLLNGEKPIPMSCTSPNPTFKLLFDITDEELNAERSKFDTASIESFIRRFGKEEGKAKYEAYRQRQSYTCSKEYMMNEHHMTEAQWKQYNQNRALTKKNYIARYGEELGLKRWKEYCDYEKYAGCSLQWFVDKYGPELGPKKLCEVNARKALTISNFIAKYGEEEGKRRFADVVRKPYSNVSQELFAAIDAALGEEKAAESRYATKNDELTMCVACKTYRADYSLYTKIIEFNGDYWHANPKFYSKDEIVNGLVVEDVWKHDAQRIADIESLGYKVKVVWENDYVNDAARVLKECIEFLDSRSLSN